MDSLSRKGVNQEDLKNYKETQKNDNLAQIEGLKENSKELAIRISDIEMRYIDKIENNDAIIQIIEDIEKQKDILDSLDPNTDKARADNTKANIKAKISELSSKGIDVSSIQNFESDPSKIDHFCTTEKSKLKKESNSLAADIVDDQAIPDSFYYQFKIADIKNAKDLKDKYKEMVGTRQKAASKITTLMAENRQIDKTIKTLEKEEKIANIAYNTNGTEKDEKDIAEEVLSNESVRRDIERQVNDRFDGGFFKGFGARMNYYKETQNVGGFKAFFKAMRMKRTKQIAAVSEAVITGKRMSNRAMYNMAKRQTDFRKTLKRETAKEMVKNPSLSEQNIRDDVISKAYESAMKDEGER